ncbi:MAG TPA: hypothetical protein PLB91_12150 [Spirochaetales bacterium]|nr:hypothetical protein [Spirochaetales bacterium]HRY54581.1 hypothetical protein [Spirochaetia bacterium]HRZ64589.1 hypothetical protein [Spirochaetia bacterium]
MQIKNPEIFSLIESIAEHYRTNISNRFTRRALSSMTLDPATWNLIEELTEKGENYRYQGYHPDELYTQVLAMARFIYQSRRQIQPNLRFLTGSAGSAGLSSSDRVFRDMAVNNFGPNLKILADKVNELYVKVVAIDKDTAGARPPVYSQISELKELGRYLVE